MAGQIYLYTGPEFGERNEAVDAVKAGLKKKFGDIDEHLFYLQETPFGQIMTILQSGTLFSNGVCVVCKGAELLKKKDDLAMISDWLDGNPDDSSVLILVSDEVSVDSKLDKLVPAQNKKKFWEMFDNQKVPWLTKFFQKNGYRINQDAAELILDMIENNTQALKNECSRFFIVFPKDHTVTVDDVEKVLTHNREESAFTLFNQISQSGEPVQKRFENGISILQKIRLSKENSSVMLIAGLASCFRKLVLWHKVCDNGMPDSFTLKVNGFSSVPMQNQYKSAAKIWNDKQATAILAILASADMEIRSGGALMEDILLEKMLYEIVIKRGVTAAVAEY
ncbi:DNA polymerase III, delta subunit [Treponema sp. JC4]|uniref:DNA polymerase III subunit delta n=1 Tax=Treponema sp. JC4 TaxID=1124982 RepID=UPI00025B0A47|nr:DNA polymerase III subunit delta [Treponema sp. JC4]EID86450.1 DNA polymerase III, delta subunit [Treponema sp. JC4]